ncbi:low temperature requirement protein A [Micromonospora sp. KC723]|uniref:low temperature requirement protein A n=1 Tax=Micromonospora sp. KC723 TaxID=2530381 RepID=UPI002110C5F1|nr:low temperature requirement protein A [Micromonospora sp. KC723]
MTLHATLGRPRVALARDAYAYLFLPMIFGLILFSLGAEEMVTWLAQPDRPLGEALHGPAVPLLFGGVICYLVGNMLFQLRALGTLTWLRVGTVVLLALLALLVPVAVRLPALAALVLVTVVCVGLVAVEVVTMADSRRALRGAVFAERTTHEAREAEWRARWHDEPPEAEGGAPVA